ncbi:MAG: hypothetical protein M1423_02630, partial [Acidobacteria bacterium]|nr:hypothetical protein [Acidobacteriota bacterium]
MDAGNATGELSRVRHDVTMLTEEDLYLFNEGTHYRLYQKLGAHVRNVDGQDGVCFSVWAPNAEAVSVIGDFNGWNKESHGLRPRGQSGIWEGFITRLGRGDLYKYHIASRFNGYRVDKTDPFAIYRQVPPDTASVVWDLQYEWGCLSNHRSSRFTMAIRFRLFP